MLLSSRVYNKGAKRWAGLIAGMVQRVCKLKRDLLTSPLRCLVALGRIDALRR